MTTGRFSQVPEPWRASFSRKGTAWEVGVLPGPNAEPDYFTEEDIKDFYSQPYSVHYNSYAISSKTPFHGTTRSKCLSAFEIRHNIVLLSGWLFQGGDS